MSKLIKSQWNHFLSLNIWLKLLILLFIIVGTVIRIKYLATPGFKYDTNLFYTWGKDALNMGYIDFWRNYTQTFDYPPGSLYFLMGLEGITRLFSDSYSAFMIALKSVNWLADIALIVTIYYTARKYGKLSYAKSILLSTFTYILPSLWFVTAFWGQLDTFLVLVMVFTFLLMFKSLEKDTSLSVFYKSPSFWSGVVFAFGLWFKLQVVLVIPVIILFAISHGKNFKWKNHLAGFFSLSFLIILVPVLTNIHRLGEVMAAPFIRSDNVSDGASTFWIALGMNGKGSDYVFQFGKFGFSVTVLGILLFLFILGWVLKKYFNISFPKNIKNFQLKKYISHIMPRNISFVDVMVILTLLTSLYYMLFTKMHERYFHLGMIFSIFALATFGIRIRNKWLWFWIILICNISYFFNVLDVYHWWYKDDGAPTWVNNVLQILGTPSGRDYNIVSSFTSVTNTICVILMCIWIAVNVRSRSIDDLKISKGRP